jgi:four helix bundle protein
MQDYHGIRAWRKAHALAINIMRLTRRFPRVGYGSLRSQMIRAAESIPNNIVEGCGAATSKEFARFLDISIKSTSELQHHLETGYGYGIIRYIEFRTYSTEAQEIRRMTWGLRRKVLGQSKPSPAADPSRSINSGSTQDGDADDGQRVSRQPDLDASSR